MKGEGRGCDFLWGQRLPTFIALIRLRRRNGIKSGKRGIFLKGLG